jgi:hypothetical protein
MHKIGLKTKDKMLMRLIGRYFRARIVGHGKRVKLTKFLGFGFKYGRINIHDNSLNQF